MIRIVLPLHLRRLAGVDREVLLDVSPPVTASAILDALEGRYPMLRGTVRSHAAQERRPMVRYFACGEDISHEPADAPLPEDIATGTEPFLIIGAMSGG